MIKDLIIGTKVRENCFVLKRMALAKDDQYMVVLSDKSGEVDAICNKDLITDDIKNCISAAVKITGVVMPGQERKPVLNIKEIAKASSDDYKPSDLFDGLSEEKIEEYISLISEMKGYVKHEGFHALLDLALSEETLSRFSVMPATLGYYGKYRGGALAAPAVISVMCKDIGCEYVIHYNALHQKNIDWSLLLTASLLVTYGVLNFITPVEPFMRTQTGVDRGYCSILQSMIEKIIYTNDLPITEEELSRLLNVICCSVASKTGIIATTKEGIILRKVLALYAELDMLDMGSSEHEKSSEEETFYYDQKLRRYISY